MRSLMCSLALLAGFLLVAGEAVAEVRVEGAWAPASLGMVPNGAAYMTLHNDGEESDRLVEVETSAAKSAEVHENVMEDDVVRMQAVESLELPPGQSVVLERGGLHIMIMGLEEPLKAGDEFSLTLTFERAGQVDISVPVKAAAGHGSH